MQIIVIFSEMQAFLSVVFFTILTSVTLIHCDCPSDFSIKYQCSCYKIVYSPITSRWNAKTDCEGQSSHLVFVNSEEEKEALSLFYPYAAPHFWIGLNGLEFEDKYWDDGTPATYTNFQLGHTLTFDDSSNCYMILSNGWLGIHPDSWFDDECTNGHSYICEYEDTECYAQTSTPDGLGCPSGFDVFLGCSCYSIRSAAWKTRDESKAKCQSLSSHLAFIESEDESNFLLQEMNDTYQYWIGANGLENEIKTWDDGTEMIYSNFGPIEAGSFNDGTGCYRVIPGTTFGGMWYDIDCMGIFGYICEYDACNRDQTTFLSTSQVPTTSQTTGEDKETTFHSTSQVQTTSQTTNQQEETTTVTKSNAQTTTQPPEVHDVGVLFGLPPNGILISGNGIVTSPMTQIRTITRCSVQCTRLNCLAFAYDEIKKECNVAEVPYLDENVGKFMISRELNCFNYIDKVICT